MAAAVGALGWLAITLVTGRREAWDSEWYFALLLPGLAVLVAWLGFFSPRGAWRWAHPQRAGGRRGRWRRRGRWCLAQPCVYSFRFAWAMCL